MAKQNGNGEKVKSMESWIWDAACSIRGAADAAKYKDYILPLIFVKRLSDVFDDEIDRIAEKVKTRTKALQLVERDKSLVRFYMPLRPKDPEKETTWDVIRTLSDKIGQQLTDILRSVAKENTSLQGIIDRIDFNATTHGQRDIDDDRLSKLIEKIAEKRLGLKDVEPDIIGRSYEYLIRKFAEGSGQSAGEFYTPAEVGFIMAKIMDAEPGMEIYDPACGSGGLLIKCELVLEEKMRHKSKEKYAPLKLFGQEFTPATWAMSKMNMVIHDMEGEIEIGDTMNHPKFFHAKKLKKFDRIVANPMWNQPDFNEQVYSNDKYDRFGFGIPPNGNADWGWMQHIFASLSDNGKAAIVLDTNAVSRGSNVKTENREKDIRKEFLDKGFIDAVILLPENLFYNTGAPGIIVFLTKKKASDILLVNASKEFVKGSPKNYIPQESIQRIVETIQERKEIEGYSALLNIEAIQDIDYDLSPQRHIPIDPEIPDWNLESLSQEIIDTKAELERINKKSKSNLAKIGKIIKSDKLPKGWVTCSFKSLLKEDISGDWGKEFPEPNLVMAAIIRGTDFPNIRLGKISSCPYRYIRETALNNKRPKEGDIITEISGGGKYQNTGRIIFITKELTETNPPLLFSNFTKLMRFDSDKILPKYVYYYWEYLYLIGRTARYEKQPTNIKNFKLDDFLTSEMINYPKSKEQQEEICKILDVVIQEQLIIKDLSNELISMQFTLFRDLLNGQRVMTNG
jgi:type I restriction enzyme M protein